jgi:hypothetical protein
MLLLFNPCKIHRHSVLSLKSCSQFENFQTLRSSCNSLLTPQPIIASKVNIVRVAKNKRMFHKSSCGLINIHNFLYNPTL